MANVVIAMYQLRPIQQTKHNKNQTYLRLQHQANSNKNSFCYTAENIRHVTERAIHFISGQRHPITWLNQITTVQQRYSNNSSSNKYKYTIAQMPQSTQHKQRKWISCALHMSMAPNTAQQHVTHRQLTVSVITSQLIWPVNHFIKWTATVLDTTALLFIAQRCIITQKRQ